MAPNVPPSPQFPSPKELHCRKLSPMQPAEKSAPSSFPYRLGNLIVVYNTIDRDDFYKIIAFVVPLDKTKEGSEEVLLL
jgi:hypothetical protein